MVPHGKVPAASREELLALAAASDARTEEGGQKRNALEENVFNVVWQSMQKLANARIKPWAAGVTIIGFLDSWVEDPIPLPHPNGVAAETTVEVRRQAPTGAWCLVSVKEINALPLLCNA